ncbi:Uncharacterised protein [Klebsiella pneumoniae]|nr:Uncharacterised protein [Klebsiella pneumoniae]
MLKHFLHCRVGSFGHVHRAILTIIKTVTAILAITIEKDTASAVTTELKPEHLSS